MRPVTFLVTAAMVLVGGCSVQRVEVPTFGPAPTVTTTPFPSVLTDPVEPVKYKTAVLKSCEEIRQAVGGDLPPPRLDPDHKIGNLVSRSCPFKAEGMTIKYTVSAWETTDDITGVKSGASYATKEFTEDAKAWEKVSGLNLGSDVRWRPKSLAACALEILDDNAVLIVASVDTSDTASSTFNDEQCRESVRKHAKKFYAAIQP